LIVDTKYEPQRTLLVASRTDLPPRVAISTLPIEWQGHDHLWENILRYVIEGRPSIAIVAKKGSSPESFNYLAATVNMRKLASNSYELRDLQELADLSLGVHDALVLDPSWDEREVLDLNEEIGLISPDTYSRVFYFRKSRQGDRIVSIMSNLKDFNRISRNALTWLVSQYDREKPYWGGSFWTTVEVMKTLHEFGRPIKQYEQGLMAEIKEHNKDGCSYDEVLGATCGLLELCYLLSGKETELYRNALQWVLRVLPEKTLYEQSTALDALLRLGEPIREALLTKFKNELMSTRKGLTNEFALHRFISTLLTCGFVQEAEQLALNLEDLQNPTDGSWINIPNTASTTLTLIHLQNRSPRPNPSIDNMIFKGVLFVKSTYSEDLYSWNNDPLATATSLRALKAFEKNIDFPIDEILRALQDVDEEARSMIAIDAAIQMNIELQEENNRLQQERVRLKDNLDTMRESEAQANKFPRNLSLITSIFSSIVLSSGLAFLYYLLNNQQSANSLLAILEDFVSENLPVVISTLAVIPLILLAILLVKYQMLPKWLEGILSELGVPSSAMKTDED
jgi:DNA-binding transcriptional MerR regulator